MGLTELGFLDEDIGHKVIRLGAIVIILWT